jgi:signal transduction histidine kinase
MTSRQVDRPVQVTSGADDVPRVGPDFRALFEAVPGCFLALDPSWLIVAASDDYLRARMVCRDAVIGRNLIDIFPDDPTDPAAGGAAGLTASLERVARNLQADVMAEQDGPVRRPVAGSGPSAVTRWRTENHPVLDRAGRLAFVLHRIEDVGTTKRTDEDRAHAEREVHRERGRISRHLNDGIVRQLCSSGMALSGVLNRTRDPEVAGRIRAVLDDLDATITNVRSTVYPTIDRMTGSAGARDREGV